MADLTPNAALNIVMRGHGVHCENYGPTCSRCLKEDAAVKVLRTLIAESAKAADVEQRHRDRAKAVLLMIKKERAMVLSGFAESAVATALADAEQRGAESAKAEAQPAGTEAATILRELWAVSQLDEPDFGRMAAVGVAHAKWIEKHGAQSPAPEPRE